jgi:hypothetical protein
MVSKLYKALLLALLLAVVTTGVVYAEEELQNTKARFFGEITNIDPSSSTFSLSTRSGDELRFSVTERTRFYSREGSIQSLEDLSAGMKAAVSAIRDDENNWIALVVAAGEVGDFKDIQRYHGIISAVDVAGRTFSLEIEEGHIQQLIVGDRTRYRSRDGSITDLEDLEVGMVAHVIAIESENQVSTALIILAGLPDEKPERFRVFGQITQVIPGQDKFELETRSGDIFTFHVIDRTKFRSRDSSINGIHDLKKGMYALVIGIQDTEGSSIALAVAAADLEDKPALSRVDVRALGKISSLDERSFTLETRGQGTLTFHVDGSTIYKSRDGSITSFEDLQIGMVAVVGGKQLGNGDLKAVVVGAMLPRSEGVGLPDQRSAGELPLGELRSN